MKPEHIQPLEYAIAERNETLRQSLQEATSFDDVFDKQLELNISLIRYVDSLNELLVEDPSEASWRTIYRSFGFAWTLAKMAESHTGKFHVEDDFDPTDGIEALRTKALAESAEYLSKNPNVEQAITTVMDYLTEGDDSYTQLAEMVAAMTCRHLDRGVQDQIASVMGAGIDSSWEKLNKSLSD